MPVDQLQNLILEIQDLKRRIKVLETSPSQQNMTVDRGATRILSDEGLQIGEPGSSTGSQIVYGVLTIVGTLNGDGTINWEGTLNQVGATNLRGPVAITGENGTLVVEAETSLEGLTTLLADLVVQAPGRIILKGTTDAILENGEFTLANGAKLAVGLTGGSSSIGMIPAGGSADISVNTLTAWMRAAAASISVTTAQARIAAPNVYMPDIPAKPSGATALPVTIDATTGALYAG